MLLAVIRKLASSLPPEIGFIVLSRSEPPPVFARLRLYGQLVVLSGHELNLTEDEAREVVVERLTGDPQISTVLADLQRRNCFVVQHGQAEPVYEYHGLFRAFLLNRAVADIPSDQWRSLQRKGADLLAEAKHIDAAAILYQGVEYWPGLSALALREGQALISQGRHQTLNRWLNCLPDGFYIETPWLCYWRGMACLPFDPVEARAHFEPSFRTPFATIAHFRPN